MSSQNNEAPVVEAKLEFDAQCPGCGASIEFNPSVAKLKCPYCDYESDIPSPENEEERTAQELAFDEAELRGNTDWGLETKTIICKECAAESIYDALQVADSCPYCGSHQVMEAQGVDTLAPNGVCTFTVTHKEAAANFHKWIAGKWFMPNEAKRSAKPDSFEGLYLPYWTFDTKTSSRYSAEYGIDREVETSDGKTKTVTDWYPTSGFYQEFIDDHLVSATKRFDVNMMKKIEPFNLKDNKAYRPEYLSGFAAERYSIGLDDGWKIAQKEISSHLRTKVERKIEREKGADSVRSIKLSTTHDNVSYKYLTLPIWISSFRYKNKSYHFMVNGQTGKVGGDVPISPIKVTFAVLVVLAVIGIFYFFFSG
jgi:predicted RNA-binding Zn-ribbon protein involved in translation (DUF1610 family)